MIDFMDSSYRSVSITYEVGKDWLVIKHFQKYTEILTEINDFINDKVSSYDSTTTDNCSFDPSQWDDIKNTFASDPLYTLVMDISSDILRCRECENGTANPRVMYDPTYGKIDGIFVKLVDALDKGAGNFLQNYTMAKQISKYECNFMPLFKKYLIIQNAIKDGSIMYYFDGIINTLIDEYKKFKYYIEYNNDNPDDDAACKNKKNLISAYNNRYNVPDNHQSTPSPGQAMAFKQAITNYKNSLNIGLTDLPCRDFWMKYILV